MSAANFITMRDFPLYTKDYDDFLDYGEIKALEYELDDYNQSELLFHKIKVQGGYYCGIQFYVDVTHDLTENDYSNDECHYYFDCCRSVAYRKYEAEIRKINRKLAALGKAYGFQELVCIARFSNGEAIYDVASNPRARLKAAAIA